MHSPEENQVTQAISVHDAVGGSAGRGIRESQELGSLIEQVDSLLTALDLITDFNKLCVEVLDMALRLSGGDSGSLMLVDDDGGALGIAASLGISDFAQQSEQRVGEGIAGRVAETGEPLLLLGRVGDERFRGVGGRPEICSSVCVPLKIGHKVVGVVNINSTPNGSQFDDAVLNRVSHFANQLGKILDRSKQFRGLRRRSLELTIRAEIEAIAYSGEPLETKLRQVVDPIRSMLEVDTLCMYLLDRDSESLRLRACSGMSMETDSPITVPVGNGLPGWVAKHNVPLVLRGQQPVGGQQLYPQLTTVGVPIRNGSELVGVMALEMSRGIEHAKETLEIANAVGSTIGPAMRDARADDDSKRKLTLLSALSEMGVAMAESQDRASFAKLTAYCSVTILESDMAFVRLLSEDQGGMEGRGSLDLMAAHGISSTLR